MRKKRLFMEKMDQLIAIVIEQLSLLGKKHSRIGSSLVIRFEIDEIYNLHILILIGHPMAVPWWTLANNFTILFSDSDNFYSDAPTDMILDDRIKPDYG